MATFKTTLRGKYKRRDEVFTVYIRVIHNRQVGYIKTHFSLEKNKITPKGNIKDFNVIERCDDMIRGYRKKCNELGSIINTLTVNDLITELLTERVEYLDFFKFSMEKIEELKKKGRISTATSMLSSIKALKKFIGKDTFDVNSLTSNLCRKFDIYLQEGGYVRRNSLYLSCIRRLHNLAIEEYNDEDIGRIVVKTNPFKKFKIVKNKKIDRDPTLTPEQIRLFYEMPISNEKQCVVRDAFMLSFFLIGTNAVDLYSCTEYDGEYITYDRTKTKNSRKDNARIKIKVIPEALTLLEKYKGEKRVFDFYKRYASNVNFNSKISIDLRRLAERIKKDYGVDFGYFIFYSARHSWATIARNDLNIDKYTIHEALNHTDSNMSITDGYIKKDFSHINRANRKVIDFVLYGKRE
jgi:integrase